MDISHDAAAVAAATLVQAHCTIAARSSGALKHNEIVQDIAGLYGRYLGVIETMQPTHPNGAPVD